VPVACHGGFSAYRIYAAILTIPIFQQDHQSLEIEVELQLLQRTVTFSGGGAQAGLLHSLEADLRSGNHAAIPDLCSFPSCTSTRPTGC
jgi:hypothetical protein